MFIEMKNYLNQSIDPLLHSEINILGLKTYEELKREILEEMIAKRDLLSKAIARLQAEENEQRKAKKLSATKR